MAIEMVVPAVGESITEVTLSSWLKQDGDFVEMDEVIAELESDKATFELTAEKAGVLKRTAAEGDTLPIGAVVCSIEEGEGSNTAAAPKATDTPAKEEAQETSKLADTNKSESGNTGGYAAGTPSPAAQKILSEKNIGTDAVQGTGPGGRITKGDALNAQPPAKTAGKTAETAVNTETTTPTAQFGGQRLERREKMSALRKTVAKRLVAVKNETAMLTTFNEVNMKPIMDLRAKYKDQFKEKYSVGLGFMSFFTKAVTEALKDFPAVNARIEGDQIVFNEFVDVSIAVSAPKGLVVPVLRNAESMSLAQIEKNILLLATKARENKLALEEMQGGTFTITNGGVFGSMMSTPIINSPQSAILGMHNIVERPIAEAGQVVIRPIMYIALSYDHRIIDGRESVGFLVKVKQYLEDPARLLLGI